MATSNYVANYNLTSWANAQAQLNSGNPQDVTIPMMDENGDITNVTVPNRGMFQKRVWDDVGGAVGQFNRTFYIDAENGDDNNDGSENSPFKTLQKAVDSVPISGKGNIILKTDITITGDVNIANKQILISKKKKIIFKIKDINDKIYVPQIKAYNALLSFRYTLFEANYNGDNDEFYDIQHRSILYSDLSTIKIWEDTKYDDRDEDYFIKIDKGDFIRLNRNIYTETNNPSTVVIAVRNNNKKIKFNSDGYFINTQYSTLMLDIYIACDILDKDDNNISLKDAIKGIARDSDSGNPINVISNVNFSD